MNNAIEGPLANVNPRPYSPFTSIHYADDRKCHLGPIKTQIQNAYVTARVSNEIIVSNEITGSEKQVPVFIHVDEYRGPVYINMTINAMSSFPNQA